MAEAKIGNNPRLDIPSGTYVEGTGGALYLLWYPVEDLPGPEHAWSRCRWDYMAQDSNQIETDRVCGAAIWSEIMNPVGLSQYAPKGGPFLDWCLTIGRLSSRRGPHHRCVACSSLLMAFLWLKINQSSRHFHNASTNTLFRSRSSHLDSYDQFLSTHTSPHELQACFQRPEAMAHHAHREWQFVPSFLEQDFQ